jgi:hypothetical protein
VAALTGAAVDLLGGEVLRGAEELSGARERGCHCVEALAMPKSASFAVPVRVEEDVARLHVAMHDARRDGPRRAPRGRRRRSSRPPSARARRVPRPVGQRLALDELHHEVQRPVRLARIEDGHCVRVDEPRRRPRLVEEALAPGGSR